MARGDRPVFADASLLRFVTARCAAWQGWRCSASSEAQLQIGGEARENPVASIDRNLVVLGDGEQEAIHP